MTMNDLSISQAKYLAETYPAQTDRHVARIMVFVIFMLLWEVTTRLQIIDSFIFSSPEQDCYYFYFNDQGRIYIYTHRHHFGGRRW